jgi:hypothetical protein
MQTQSGDATGLLAQQAASAALGEVREPGW